MSRHPGLWPSPWPAEDGGPRRLQVPATGDGIGATVGPQFVEGAVAVTSREAPAATMVVLRDPGEVFLLRHTGGEGSVSWVERIDPVTLEPLARSADLPGGPTWPGGLAAHADGSLHVVFGNHAHRLSTDLAVLASVELPRRAPYNSFVTLPDGHLVTKDFGGVLPGADPAVPAPPPAELCVLEPTTLAIVDRVSLPEPSVARLSADGATVYAVGTSALHRAHWRDGRLALDPDFAPVYRTQSGQTYGWDAVIALGAAWFLDDGEGTHAYAGSFRGLGGSTAPLHVVRIDLATGAVTLTEICGRPGGIIANPPVVDEARRIVVGYDSGNGVLAAFSVADDGTCTLRWRHEQNHASHLVLFPDTGELVTADHDPAAFAESIVVRDIASGAERLRVASGSPVQSVLFPAAGFDRDIYYCSFTTVTRVAARGGTTA